MSKEKIITISLIAIFSGAIVFMGSKVAASAMEKKWDNSNSTALTNLEKEYAQKIEQQKDVNALMESGYNLLRGNQINSAILNFKRVTVLEKDCRDGWLYLGIAELKNNEPGSALNFLKNAEKIDPINPQTYEYLSIAYEKTDNQEAAQKAREKYDFLTKKK